LIPGVRFELTTFGLLVYTAALELDLSATSRRILLCCAGVLLGLAGACKWNAVDTLAVLLVASLALYWMADRSIVEARSLLFVIREIPANRNP